MTRHPYRAPIAGALCFLLAALAAFPTYCDYCSYRFVSAAPAPVPAVAGGRHSCCVPAASPRSTDRHAHDDGDGGKGPHARDTFCLTGSLLTTIATHVDIPLLVRRPLAAAQLPVLFSVVARGHDVSDPGKPRAPPA